MAKGRVLGLAQEQGLQRRLRENRAGGGSDGGWEMQQHWQAQQQSLTALVLMSHQLALVWGENLRRWSDPARTSLPQRTLLTQGVHGAQRIRDAEQATATEDPGTAGPLPPLGIRW